MLSGSIDVGAHVGREIDVRVPEHRRHRQRIALIGVGAEQLVIDRRRTARCAAGETERRDPLDVGTVAQLVIDPPVGDGVAHALTVLVVVDEPVEDGANDHRSIDRGDNAGAGIVAEE